MNRKVKARMKAARAGLLPCATSFVRWICNPPTGLLSKASMETEQVEPSAGNTQQPLWHSSANSSSSHVRNCS